MKSETRYNAILAGVILAALGLLCAYDTLDKHLSDALAFHADTGLHMSASGMSAANMVRLAGSAVLFAAGLGLSLYAALCDRRLK